MHKFTKLTSWVLGAAIVVAPVATAAEAAATQIDNGALPVPTSPSRPILHTGKVAVEHFVYELERKDGKDYVTIDFTSNHSANVEVLPDGQTVEGQKKVHEIGEVLKLNGYDDVRYWSFR